MFQFGNVKGHGRIAEGAEIPVSVFANLPELPAMFLDFIGNVEQMGLLHGVVKFNRSNLNRFKCPVDFLRCPALEEDFTNPAFEFLAFLRLPQCGITAAQYLIEDFQLVSEKF